MEHVQKQENQEWGVARLKFFLKNLIIFSLTIVFWANVMNEQWQINDLISWKFLFSLLSSWWDKAFNILLA